MNANAYLRITLPFAEILRQKRLHAKELSEKLIACKDEIEKNLKQIEKTRSSSSNTVGSDGQTEAALLQDLAKKRAEYRDTHEEMKKLKAEMDTASRLVDQARRRLAAEFELWYRNTYGTSLDRSMRASQFDLAPEISAGEVIDLYYFIYYFI